MGIIGLSKLIADIAPHAVKEMEIKNYFGPLNMKWPCNKNALIIGYFNKFIFYR